MERNHSLNEFTGGLNSLRRNHRDPYSSGDVDKLSDQFSSLSLLSSKPRKMTHLPWSFQVLRVQDLSSANLVTIGEPIDDQRLYKVYQLHLSRLRKNDSQQDRPSVLQRGMAHRNVTVLKESVGTGVFHPLQRPTSKPVVKSIKNRNQSEKKSMIKERRGVMSPMSTTRKQQQQEDECHYHLPLDLDFSKDWTF